jgi:hypothetical protein
LTLEGLTLWRRGRVVNFALLISVEDAPLHLLNCRILRSVHQGQNIVGWGRLRVSPEVDSRRYRALLGFQHGSTGHLLNCVIAGTQAASIECRASARQPTQVKAENCLFFTDKGFYLNREATTGVSLRSTQCVFVTGALLDLRDTEIAGGHSFMWTDCVVDRTGGALVRLGEYSNGAKLRAIEWRETNVIHVGEGAWLADRRGHQITSAAEWNDLMQLSPGQTQLVGRQAFPETCVRSGPTLQAVDLAPETLSEMQAGDGSFDPRVIGEGTAYATFRRSPAYREWRNEVRAMTARWERER